MNGEYTAEIVLPPAADRPANLLASLFDSHYERIYCLARRLSRGADDALDLVQETFLRAARFPSSVPVNKTDQEAWLVRVLVNICRDQWRKSQVRARHAKAAAGHSPSPGGHDAEAALIARATVWRALEALPPRRRAIVVMFELEGLVVAEIARLLNINAVTARWHLAMGRRELARALNVSKGEPKR